MVELTRSRVLLQKLTGPELVKKFRAFYGTRRFITAFTTVGYMFPSQAISPKSKLPIRFMRINLNTIPPSTPSSSKWLYPSGFPTKSLHATFLLSMNNSWINIKWVAINNRKVDGNSRIFSALNSLMLAILSVSAGPKRALRRLQCIKVAKCKVWLCKSQIGVTLVGISYWNFGGEFPNKYSDSLTITNHFTEKRKQ